MKTIQVHSLFSLPVHVPNRGADGLAKRAMFGGVERQRISYQAQQYALRNSPALAALEAVAGIGHSYRTALVGERLIAPNLQEDGVPNAEQWAGTLLALWRKEKEWAGKIKSIWSEDEGTDTVKAAKKGRGKQVEDANDEAVGTSEDKDAPLIIGEQEVRLFVAVVRALVAEKVKPDELWTLMAQKPPKNTPAAVVTAIDALRTRRGAVGLDGALFGRMATGVAVANVNRAVRIGDALTTHAITPVVDFFLTTDDLKDRAAGEAGGSHINTREEAAGLFYRHVLIDTAQLTSNGVEPESVIEPLVAALLTVSPIGNRSPARVVETLVEVGAQVRSLMDAYASPVAQQDKAVERLRDAAAADYDLYGMPAAALWLSEQQTPRVPSLAAATLAAWRS